MWIYLYIYTMLSTTGMKSGDAVGTFLTNFEGRSQEKFNDKTPILVDSTMKSDEPSVNIDVIPEAKASELRYSVRKNVAIVNEPENNSKKQSVSESAADIKVSLMVICCPCPENECKELDKCDCKESDKCDCKESDKCDCKECECKDCECKDCECKKTDKECDKSYCLDQFPFFSSLCTCFGHIPKDRAQTYPKSEGLSC